MSKEEMIREIVEILEESSDMDVQDIYWMIKENVI